MIRFTAPIQYFSNNKDKTGWSFVMLNKAQSEKLNPGVRTGFRVKGTIDSFEFKQKSLLPVREGRFMFTLDATIRKAIKKRAGDTVKIELEVDKKPLKISADLLACLQDDPIAEEYFKKLAPSHQRYFSKWIEDAKTDATKAKRIAMALMALGRKMDYGAMLREGKETNRDRD